MQGEEPSVAAMLLQMALEKLGKAGLLRSGTVTLASATTTHRAATPMVRQLAGNKRACARLGWRAEVVRQVLPHVDALERAQPQLAAGGPCLEYPWQDAAGIVRTPCRDLALVRLFTPRNNAGQFLFRFARDLAAKFDDVYP